MSEVDVIPTVTGMAIVTGIGAGNVVDRLAGGNTAVVATRAGTIYGVVIHLGYRGPNTVVMAVVTGVTGIDMSRMFTRGRGAVVTA